MLSCGSLGMTGGPIMKRRSKDPNMPIGKLTLVRNFLPPPHELVIPNRSIKVTIQLTESSVAFFKREARKRHTKYQKMIRELLDRYAERYRAA